MCCIPSTNAQLSRVGVSLGLVSALTLPIPMVPTQAHPSAASVGSRTGVRGEVRVSPLSDFIGERTLADVFIEPDPGVFLPEEVVRRALSRLHERNWWLLSNNCEHCAFLSFVLFGEPTRRGGSMAVGREGTESGARGGTQTCLGGCGHRALPPIPRRIPLAPCTEPRHRLVMWTRSAPVTVPPPRPPSCSRSMGNLGRRALGPSQPDPKSSPRRAGAQCASPRHVHAGQG